MDADFNTLEGVAMLVDLAIKVMRTPSTALARQLRALGGLLGLLPRESEGFLRAGTGDEISEAQIGALIAERNEARRAENFRRGDEVHRGVSRRGGGPQAGPPGTTWRRR